MKHAYLIIAHNEYEVLKALLNLLDNEHNTIFVHVDRRAEALYRKIKTTQTQHARLHILTDRIPVYWSDISQVKVEYLLLETAMKQDAFDYYHLLSGVDLPLKTQNEIVQFFEEHKGKEFVSFWNTPAHQKDLNRKISFYYFFTKHRRRGEKWHALTVPLFNVVLAFQKLLGIRRKKEMEFKKGPNWFSITHAFAQYLVSQKYFIEQRLKFTLCPDEIFVQTVLWNSPFKSQIFDLNDEHRGNMRLTDWKRGNPYMWQNSDFNELTHSPMLFARKFSYKQAKVVDELQQYITEKSRSN